MGIYGAMGIYGGHVGEFNKLAVLRFVTSRFNCVAKQFSIPADFIISGQEFISAVVNQRCPQ